MSDIKQPKAFREGTWDERIWRDVVSGEYGEIDFEGKIVVDIGAHIGAFSVLAASKGADTVYALEPSPANFDLLRRNVESFHVDDVVEVYKLAVIGFSDGRERQRDAHYWHPSDNAKNTGGGGVATVHADGAVEVETLTLDDLFCEISGGADVLKLDCEGAEYPILFTSGLVAWIDLIVGEYHPRPEGEAWRANVLWPYLEGWGFEVSVRPTVQGFGKFTARRK